MSDDLTTSPDYAALVTALAEHIVAAQVRAATAVNRELVLLYWQMGRDISARMREHGWSRNVPAHQIDTRLHDRQGKTLSNFDRTLPAPQSDLARQLLKDPYNFDFLTLGDDARTRLENDTPPAFLPFHEPSRFRVK